MKPNKQDLDPREVVVDLVVGYSPTMPRNMQAAVLSDNLIIYAQNHRDQRLTLSLPVHFDGDPFDGYEATPPRFVLRKLGPTVWKLSPSIRHDLLHAFVTIVGVPEDAAWGKS